MARASLIRRGCRTWVIGLLAAALLVACGGGGGGGGGGSGAGAAPPSNPPPVVTPPAADPPVIPPPPPPQPFAGSMVLVAGDPGGVGSVDGTGRWARFNGLGGIAVDAAGAVYAADTGNFAVRRISPEGVVSTVAGRAGQSGTTDGTGGAARFTAPTDVVVMSDGTLYVADAGSVRRVSPAGQVTTVPTPGLPAARSLAADGIGNLYLSTGSAIYRMAPGTAPVLLAGFHGIETTYDGRGTEARFDHITDIVVGRSGVLYVAEYYGALRKVGPDGQTTTVSHPGTTMPTVFGSDMTLAADVAGDIWISLQSAMLLKISGDDVLTVPFTTLAEVRKEIGYSQLGFLAFNAHGDLYFTRPNGLARLSSSGKLAAVAGSVVAATSSFAAMQRLVVDAQGDLYLIGAAEYGTGRLSKYSGAGEKLPFGSDGQGVLLPGYMGEPHAPVGLGIDLSGAIVVGIPLVAYSSMPGDEQVSGGRIDSVSPAGSTSTLGRWAGNGPGAIAPANLVIDRQGDSYFIDLVSGRLMKRSKNGELTTLANLGAPFLGFTRGAYSKYPVVDASGRVHVVDTAARVVWRIVAGEPVLWAGSAGVAGAADGAGMSARFNAPTHAVADSLGNLYLADGELLRRIAADGTVSTIAGSAGNVGLVPGSLPASLGKIRALALASDRSLFVLVDQALVKITLP